MPEVADAGEDEALWVLGVMCLGFIRDSWCELRFLSEGLFFLGISLMDVVVEGRLTSAC